MPTTPNVIKELVEASSHIKDISIKSRKRYISDCRFVFFAMCRKYTKAPYEQIGKLANRNHATVIHGVKVISELLETPNFLASHIYKDVDNRLKIICNDDEPFDALNCLDISKLHQYYRIKHIMYIEKHHQVINALLKRIEEYKNIYELIGVTNYKEISNLDYNEFQDLNNRIELFLKVNKKLKKNEPKKTPIS